MKTIVRIENLTCKSFTNVFKWPMISALYPHVQTVIFNKTFSPPQDLIKIRFSSKRNTLIHYFNRVIWVVLTTPCKLGCKCSINYRLTNSASELSGFTRSCSLTVNEKFQCCTRLCRVRYWKFRVHCTS